MEPSEPRQDDHARRQLNKPAKPGKKASVQENVVGAWRVPARPHLPCPDARPPTWLILRTAQPAAPPPHALSTHVGGVGSQSRAHRHSLTCALRPRIKNGKSTQAATGEACVRTRVCDVGVQVQACPRTRASARAWGGHAFMRAAAGEGGAANCGMMDNARLLGRAGNT